MQIKKNISLKPYNTFNVEANAKYFVVVNTIPELKEVLVNKDYLSENKLIIGGGSNILFTQDYSGLVIKLNNSNIEILSETKDNVFVKVEAGIEWDYFVKYTIDKGLSGFENLSLIPGNVGAAPIQNIGAYGVEVKDLIESVNLVLVDDLSEKTLQKSECNFGYRNSIFKNELKDKFIITSVVFKLSKKQSINLDYQPLKNYFQSNNISNITSQEVRDAVISIRESKLPNPKEIGNAGSFFKNPIISAEKYEHLKSNYNDLIGYPESDSKIKISAGWLIEKCGLKGKRDGNVGIHEKQALVIVNFGDARGKEIVEFSKAVQKKVYEKFNIELINEVNII